MRREGELEKVKEIEQLILSHGGRVRSTRGDKGAYKSMGVDDASRKHVRSFNMPVSLVITLSYDERVDKGRVSIKDDNVGRLTTRIPGLLELLGQLEEIENEGQGRRPFNRRKEGDGG